MVIFPYEMKIHSITGFLSLLAVACSTLDAQELRTAAPPAKPAFVFRGVGYFHRWSKNDQHEFTPEKQENLDKWSDMMTVNAYPDVHDGERLAGTGMPFWTITKDARQRSLRPIPSLGQRIGRRNI